MKSALRNLSFLLGLFSLNSVAEPYMFAAPETLWVKNQGIQIANDSIQLSPSSNLPDLNFQTRNSKALLEKGDLSLQRKILLNASGTEISTDVFMWDLQLEVHYKFI
jgi:hypothetical protein